MLSSHSVKRSFRKFTPMLNRRLRVVLRHLFAWRLRLEQPSVVILGIDTMVMNNDDAALREGVEPTYRKVKGFQPLQLNWKGFFVDASFRSGSKHSNHGTDVQKMVTAAVKVIRRELGDQVPIFSIGTYSGRIKQCLRSAVLSHRRSQSRQRMSCHGLKPYGIKSLKNGYLANTGMSQTRL